MSDTFGRHSKSLGSANVCQEEKGAKIEHKHPGIGRRERELDFSSESFILVTEGPETFGQIKLLRLI